MTNEEIIAGLRTHIDMRADCENCPLDGQPMCFDKLVLAAIDRLERQEGDQT